MASDWQQIMIAIVGAGGVGASIQAVVTLLRSRQQARIELANSSTTNAQTVADMAFAMADRLDKRVTALEAQNRDLNKTVSRLKLWAYDVSRRWQELRQHPTPPPLPTIEQPEGDTT